MDVPTGRNTPICVVAGSDDADPLANRLHGNARITSQGIQDIGRGGDIGRTDIRFWLEDDRRAKPSREDYATFAPAVGVPAAHAKLANAENCASIRDSPRRELPRWATTSLLLHHVLFGMF